MVDRWEILGESIVPGAASDLVAAINEVPGDDVLVLVRSDGEPVVVPYRTA